MKRILAVEDKLATDEQLDLSDDWSSCKLFWGTILDFVKKDGADELNFNPSDGDSCLTAVIDKHTYELVPVPFEVRQSLLNFAQRIALGWFSYMYFVRLRKKPFARERRAPILVAVGNRHSHWKVNCTQGSVRFLCVD